MSEIINKVAQSGLITLNPEDFAFKGTAVGLDIKDWLFHGLILKEKEFREHIKNQDWNQYQDQAVAIYCSTDAIIPSWAFMLIAIHVAPVASFVHYGTIEDMQFHLFKEALDDFDFESMAGERVVVKGCGQISTAMYVEITRRLRPVAKSIMYGEPCSTVPLYKQR